MIVLLPISRFLNTVSESDFSLLWTRRRTQVEMESGCRNNSLLTEANFRLHARKALPRTPAGNLIHRTPDVSFTDSCGRLLRRGCKDVRLSLGHDLRLMIKSLAMNVGEQAFSFSTSGSPVGLVCRTHASILTMTANIRVTEIRVPLFCSPPAVQPIHCFGSTHT